MKIYNETKTEIIENPNLELGELIDDTLTTHIPYSPKRERRVHEEVLAEYPNGGEETIEVVDEEEREEILEHDETEEIKVYIPYTEERLAKIKRTRELESELYTLKTWLSEHDYIGTKIATGRATVDEYKDEIAEMTVKADRINEIEAELASLQ